MRKQNFNTVKDAPIAGTTRTATVTYRDDQGFAAYTRVRVAGKDRTVSGTFQGGVFTPRGKNASLLVPTSGK